MADAAHDQRKKSLEAFLADVDRYNAEADNKELVDGIRHEEREAFEAESRGRIERKVQKEAMQTRISYGGLDAGGPGPDWGKVIVDLGTERDELKAKWEAADKEVKRLNQVNFELVTAQRNAAFERGRLDGVAQAAQGDPFEAHEPPEKFSLESVRRVVGESELQHLQKSYDELAGHHEYAIQYARLARRARHAAWREKEQVLDDLKDARKEIARLNEVLQDELRSRATVAELAQKKRPRVDDDAAANY